MNDSVLSTLNIGGRTIQPRKRRFKHIYDKTQNVNIDSTEFLCNRNQELYSVIYKFETLQ